MESDLNANDKQRIEREEAILHAIQQAIESERLQFRLDIDAMRRRFDEIREETIGLTPQGGAEESDLPMLYGQMHTQIAVANRKLPTLPNPAAPYFARMVLEENGKQRTVLLGYHAFIPRGQDIAIIDWRNAPIAKIFFQYREGDEYQVDLPGRAAVGVVIERSIVTVMGGKIVRIHDDADLFENVEGVWRRGSVTPTLAGGQGAAIRSVSLGEGRGGLGTGATGRASADVVALLDPAQYALLNAPVDRTLLILGGAGSGKTTVAIHRMAALMFVDRNRFRPENISVIVPDPGLVRLSQNLLKSIGQPKVRAQTFDSWIDAQRRRLFKGLPKRICEDTPANVVRVKRHPGLLQLIRPFVQKTRGRKADIARDRWEFFSDRELLRQLIGMELGGKITQADIEAVIRHSSEQHKSPSEDNFKGIDEERLQTLDGRSLDAGTPDEIRGTIDIEDFPVLLEIWRQRNLTGSVSKVSHLVVDEAQEFSEIELAALGQALREPLSVSVAGDAAQQTDTLTHFRGWEHSIAALGVDEVHTETLLTNYRSPKPIADLTAKVLGPLAKDHPVAQRDGAPVKASVYPEFGVAMIDLIEELSDLRSREPRASIAVIARSQENAEKVFRSVNEALDVRLVIDGDFSFAPGVDITCVSEVKGLEFDYVVIPDADAFTYQTDSESRRSLYVAASRAMHQLWLMSISRVAPLVDDRPQSAETL